MPTIITRGAASALQFYGKAAVNPPQPLSSLISADPNILTFYAANQTRTPADKISNYVYFFTPNLTVGVKYCYIMGTVGDRSANRNLANGTVISSRGYNNGIAQYTIDSMIYQYVKNGVGFQWSYGTTNEVSSYGTFTYNPQLIVAGDGSSATGHLIARNTYNVSDAGKGGVYCVALDYDYFFNMCVVNGITFVDNNNNSP